MPFTDIPTEQTTAATDLLLALLSAGSLLYLRRFQSLDSWKVSIWSWIFGLLALGALLGAIAHGFTLPQALNDLIWKPIYLSLGWVVALFVVAAIYDWRGRLAARRLVPVMLVVGVAFFGVTQLFTGTFLVFILYEAVAMIAALAIYANLAIRQRLAGADVIATAVLLNIVAAGIQASKAVHVQLIWTFDHNGIFHIVQIVAILVLLAGLQRSLVGASSGLLAATAQ